MTEKSVVTPTSVTTLFYFVATTAMIFQGLGSLSNESGDHFSFVWAVLRCSALSITCMVAAQK